MSRLHTLSVSEATGELAETFSAIKKAVGKVPNAYATIGSNMPKLLAQVLQTGAVLQSESGLDKRELEAINLAVSEDSGCDYCVAAHTLTGKAAGYSAEQTRALRNGEFLADAKIDALVKFALRLVNTRGTLPQAALAEIRLVGYTDRQIVGAIGATSAILFTNMLNRVNDTSLDFPKPDPA
jgi:uncharacterized peroxidase-related enzyme